MTTLLTERAVEVPAARARMSARSNSRPTRNM